MSLIIRVQTVLKMLLSKKNVSGLIPRRRETLPPLIRQCQTSISLTWDHLPDTFSPDEQGIRFYVYTLPLMTSKSRNFSQLRELATWYELNFEINQDCSCCPNQNIQNPVFQNSYSNATQKQTTKSKIFIFKRVCQVS